MIKVKTGFRGKNAQEKLERAENISKNLAEYKLKGIPNESIQELKRSTRALKIAIGKSAFGDRREIAIRREKEAQVENAIRRIALFVSALSLEDKDLILKTGFELRIRNNKAILPEEPTQLEWSRTQNDCEILLKWKPVANSRSYVIEINPEGSKKWKSHFSTKSRFLLEKLKPGKYYKIRIRAIGAKGLSKPSSTCRFMAA